MIPIPTRLARELDRRAVADYGMHSLQLMENAGRGVADALERLGAQGPVVVACGWGNNGGDGLVIARHLDLRSIPTRVLLFVTPDRLAKALAASAGESPPTAAALELGPDVATNYTILRSSGVELRLLDSAGAAAERLAGADWIVDALLGTGAQGEPRSPLDAAIDCLNASGRPILAVDLPSGLDADTGAPASHVIRATHTCTFVAPKPGLLAPEAAEIVGQLSVLDIGAPRQLVEEILSEAAA